MLVFVLELRGATAKNMDLVLSDVFVKVNCHPSLFEVDLKHEVDPDHPKTLCRVGAGQVTLRLKKRTTGLWHEFRANGTKAELRVRRAQALAAADQREKELYKNRDDRKHEKLKAGEHEQWRLDRENREQIEKWQAEEKAKWERDVYAAFDEQGQAKATELADRRPEDTLRDGDVLPQPQDGMEEDPAQPQDGSHVATPTSALAVLPVPAAATTSVPSTIGDTGVIWTKEELEGLEEYVPDPRETQGKIMMRFSERVRPGVPARDRGVRPPPFPKGTAVGDAAPPMMAGENRDESDPVWLKDKADALMAAGDYQGAFNAYTEALKIGTNARAFANRAVADLYLGNLTQCIEDCNRSLSILDLRNRVPEGQMPPLEDPEDQAVRARLQVRIGTAYLWLGALRKAEEHFDKAVATDGGLDAEERRRLTDDVERVRRARQALVLKERADHATRRLDSADSGSDALRTALDAYEECVRADDQSTIVRANRCFAQLRAGNLQDSLADADIALNSLRQWPIARRAPKLPARPARLEPPFLDDPTFTHPDQQKQGEVDWLMKHAGGSADNLPSLPSEYEWVRDVAEKSENAWIAVKKKMTKATVDAIRKTTHELQDALYTRKPQVIRSCVEVASEQNRGGIGPSSKAIHQAEDYATKLAEFALEREAEHAQDAQALEQEFEECDLAKELAGSRSGVARSGFVRGHPVEVTRRRIFVKIKLRRARVLEMLGDTEASVRELRVVLEVESNNTEAKQRLAVLAQVPASPPPECSEQTTVLDASVTTETAASSGLSTAPTSHAPRSADVPSALASSSSTSGRTKEKVHFWDDEEEEPADHASPTTLLDSASEYIRRNDFGSALEVFNYLRRACKALDAFTELKILSNTSLCLQKLRGRLPDLISICTEAVDRIQEMENAAVCEVPAETLLRMKCACLSRRGNALGQQGKHDESQRDAVVVRELLARVATVESGTGDRSQTA